MSRSHGHCMTMGTASTMACVTEGLGLRCPGRRPFPLPTRAGRQSRRRPAARSWSWSSAGSRPSDLMTRDAFENAIRVLHAISGSTNAILHLIAYAGRLGIDLPLGRFDELSADDAVARRRQAFRAAPDGGLLLRRRPAGGDERDPRPPPPGRPHRVRATVGENLAGAEIIDRRGDRAPASSRSARAER